VRETQQDQRAADIPAPTRHKHRRLEHSGKQNLAECPAGQKPEHGIERKTVLLAKRNHNPIVGRGSLQFEVERDAEPLPQSEAPGPIDPPSEGRVQDQLHAAAFIEEPLRHNGLLCRDSPKHRLACQHILDRLLRASLIQGAFLLEPVKC